jgi:hypothetical protein
MDSAGRERDRIQIGILHGHIALSLLARLVPFCLTGPLLISQYRCPLLGIDAKFIEYKQ